MNNEKMSFRMEITGDEGIFRIEKYLSIFHSHVTEKNLMETMKEVKKEIVKLGKKSDLIITIYSMNENYHSENIHRYVTRKWDNNILESRKYNGFDFGDIKEITFVNNTDLIKFLMKQIKEHVQSIIKDIPSEICYFAQSID